MSDFQKLCSCEKTGCSCGEEGCVTLQDENGKKIKFIVIDVLEMGEEEYAILLPLEEEPDEAIILKFAEDEEGSEILVDIEDDEEWRKAADAYEKMVVQIDEGDLEPIKLTDINGRDWYCDILGVIIIGEKGYSIIREVGTHEEAVPLKLGQDEDGNEALSTLDEDSEEFRWIQELWKVMCDSGEEFWELEDGITMWLNKKAFKSAIIN